MADVPFSLKIEGMHCGGCVRRVQKALGDVPGVQLAKVEVGQAEGTLDGADTDIQELLTALDKIGFFAKVEA